MAVKLLNEVSLIKPKSPSKFKFINRRLVGTIERLYIAQLNIRAQYKNKRYIFLSWRSLTRAVFSSTLFACAQWRLRWYEFNFNFHNQVKTWLTLFSPINFHPPFYTDKSQNCKQKKLTKKFNKIEQKFTKGKIF